MNKKRTVIIVKSAIRKEPLYIVVVYSGSFPKTHSKTVRAFSDALYVRKER